VAQVRDARFGRHLAKWQTNDFAPRVGIAYSLTPKTIIRSGAGIYFVREIGNSDFEVVRNPPFAAQRGEPAQFEVPNLNFQRPFAQPVSVPTFALAVQFNEPTAYVAQWSWGIQQQLSADTMVAATYLGAAGNHLRRMQIYNQAPPGPGDIQARRPNPQLGTVQTVTGASHSLFNFKSYTDLGTPRDLAKIFDNDAYISWNQFRGSDDAKYVGLCLPHVLMRLPYGKDTAPVEEFDYEEGVDGRDHSKYLWGNAAYAFGARLTDAFARHEWCAAIRGVEGGGLVEGLPLHNFKTDEGDETVKVPTEIAITDRREKELADQGFASLCHCKGTDYAAFFSVQSAQKAKVYDKADANASARLSTQIPYILAVSRFAHYLKAMMRDKVGSFMSRSDAEVFLTQWIIQYVCPDDAASHAAFRPGSRALFYGPGGIAYVSYNCMPGWAQCMPVQRLLFDIAALGSERSDRKMRRAAAMMEKLRDAGAMALKGNPFVDQILRSGTSSHDTYLVHEYLNESWHPLYHADVARELAVAKLAYVGSGDLLCNFPAFMLSPEQREIVEQAESAELRETLLDICVDRRFRLDVFVRGRRQMSRARQADLLGQLRLLLMVPRSEFKLKVRLPAGEADLSPTTYGTIADLLAEQPRSVRDLLDQVRQRAGHEIRAAEIVATLIGMAQALPLKDGAAADDPPSADRLNRALLERVDEMDPYGHVGLVVPALGTGVRCGFAEAFLLRAQISGADDVLGEAARDALRVLASRGQDVLKDGQPVPEAEALDIVRNKVRQVTATKLPVWQKLLPQLQRPT
jgi:hypothetical protein